MEMFTGVVILLLGYGAGLLTQGVRISVNHSHTSETTSPNTESGYNESTEQHLPEEIRDYAEKNKGFINF